ncbi:hypothetical protein ACFL1B_03570 [Nanoarchaeota archaeon]
MGRRDRRASKRRQQIINWIIIIIMVVGFGFASIVLYSPASNNQDTISLKYNGYKFVEGPGYYNVKVDGAQRRFYFHPVAVENIRLPAEVISALQPSPVITLTFDPYSDDIETIELVKYQLDMNLDKVIYPGVINSSELYGYPILSCANASPQFPMIYLETSNTTKTTYENGCVIIQARESDLLRSAERIMYEILGVIDG